ncbi:unnamed protein product [Prorocentrum cordatum]|uniref:Uncharacterized protein n=1 Tax=Prorocentrum cordatum TaxID=2364126 RepID=A0ABN9TCZ1_9DINO|nr:unnamed protein product [Polarella glacialis]CAK0843580.1 unnamed protein product [Polarella glacialis]
MAAAARMLTHALPMSQGQALPAPGTEAPYAGSRRLAQRYEYKGTSFSGMVELHPQRLLTREEFKTNLLAAPGVLKVVDKSSKTLQGIGGDHVFEQNLEVHLHREPHVALEFEITRNNHMKHMEGRPYTETAMFKGRELLPQHARDNCKSCLTRHGTWEDDVLPEGLEGIPLEPGFASPAGSPSSPTQAPGLPTAPGLAGSPTQAPSRKPTFPYPFQNAPAMPGGQATATAARVEPCPTESATMSQGGRGVPLEPGFASSAGVEASINQGGATGPPAKKSKAAPGGAAIAPAAQVSGGARQASCPEGLNYCEAGVTELRAFERDGNIASLVKAQDLLLKGIERISDVLPEGRDLDGTEYETLGAEFNRFAEIAEDARVRMRTELEAARRPAGGEQAAAGEAQGSGPGFASPATQGQKNQDTADAEKTPPGFDPEADWTEDTADVHQFDITADLREELAEKPDGGPAAARESREVRAALGAEVLPIPDVLKLAQGQPMDSNAALDDVRAMKSRGVEHVRHRVIDEPSDPEVQDNIDRMRREAWEKHEERRRTCARGLDTRDMFLGRELVYVKLVSAGAVPMTPNEFLNAASKRSLCVEDLSRPPPNTQAREGRLRMLALREHYQTLFKELPHKAAQKFSPNQLGDDDGPSKALVGLVNHHSGEVVELDGCRTQWCLRKVAPGSASAAQFENPQFWRVQGGYTVGRRPEGRREHGRRGSELFAKAVDAQAQREAAAVNEGEDINPQVYMPAWARQWSRACAPCEAVETREWCRQSPVTTLGQLFWDLGRTHTAKAIYAFYRTLRLVALKRDKNSSTKASSAPGFASASRPAGSAAAFGFTGSDLQAPRIRADYSYPATNREVLVEDYIEAVGLSTTYVSSMTKQELLDEAAKCATLALPGDMRPPWLDHAFPQALPGDGFLSEFTRPSFLYWGASFLDMLFGTALGSDLNDQAVSVDYQLAGAIARPLYKCAQIADASTGAARMNVASMSKLLRDTAGRGHYTCKECAERKQGADDTPGFPSVALRALHLYPAVFGPDGEPTPLRAMTPHRVFAHAPPEKRGRGVERVQRHVVTQANPTISTATPTWHTYNAEESEATWIASSAFKATPPSKT